MSNNTAPHIFVRVLTFVFFSTFFVLLFLSDIEQRNAQAQAAETEVYWVYERGNLGYRLPLSSASQQGVQVDRKTRKLIFRIQMNGAAHQRLIQNKNNFPLHIEWYRYNRAKLSFFCSERLQPEDIHRINIKGDIFYRLSSSQQNILEGTWIVKISDAKGNLLEFDGKKEFDVIVF